MVIYPAKHKYDIRIRPKQTPGSNQLDHQPTMELRRQLYRLYKQCHSFACIPKYSSIARISYIRPSARTITDLRSRSEPRVFPSSGWENIEPSFLVEKENIPNYKPENFYPVRIGEVFNHRYQVVGKLGYGLTATVWLCRDLL